MESITVGYSRKTSKNFDSFGVNASVEFKPTTEDMQKEIDQALLALKLILDPQLEQFAGKSGGSLEGPDLGPEPEWVGQHPERTAELLGRIEAPTPPPPPSSPEPADEPATPAETPAAEPIQPVSGDIDGEKVYLGRAKVFRVNIKRSKTNKVFAELRVGHDDLAAYGFDEHYVTARIFDPAFVAVVGSLTKVKVEGSGEIKDIEELLINKGDFVDLWGTFSAWQTDPTKFDINGTAIKKSQ